MDPNSSDIQSQIYLWFAKRYKNIVPFFKLIYFAIFVFIVISAYFSFSNSFLDFIFYKLGRTAGQAALALLGLVVLPGILGRFRIEIKITRLITLFRRQLGITVFLLSFSHYFVVRILPIASGKQPFIFPFAAFEMLGLFSLYIMFFMFLTSNNYSQKKLGKWWKRLHRFVYLAIWLLVLHTTMQRISIWSFGILIVGVLEIASLFYAKFKASKSPVKV